MMCRRRRWRAIRRMRWFFRNRRVAVGVWLAGTLALPGAAQTVQFQLRNGDRVSGVIVTESPTGITLKTAWGGTIGVPANEIIVGQWVAAANGVPPAVLSPVASPSPPQGAPAKVHKWIGEIQVGADLLFSERNRQLYSGRAKITHMHGLLRNLLDYQAAYGESEGELTDNRMFASLKTDYELNPRWYAYNLGGAAYDELRQIDFQWE